MSNPPDDKSNPIMDPKPKPDENPNEQSKKSDQGGGSKIDTGTLDPARSSSVDAYTKDKKAD